MSKAALVKINTDYVAQFMKETGISGAEFGKRLGYSEYWWKGVVNKNQSVKPNVAFLIEDVFGIPYDKLVVKADPIEECETLTVDGEVVEAFGKWVERVESKLDKLLSLWESE